MKIPLLLFRIIYYVFIILVCYVVFWLLFNPFYYVPFAVQENKRRASDIINVLEQYYQTNNKYPANLDELTSANYIKEIPKPKKALHSRSNEFYYSVKNNPQKFTLRFLINEEIPGLGQIPFHGLTYTYNSITKEWIGFD
ncbi:MAG: hypothetical protein V1871_08040 [Planctomycetota bacterium]